MTGYESNQIDETDYTHQTDLSRSIPLLGKEGPGEVESFSGHMTHDGPSRQ
mgnify:CR=1 FL=1